MYSSRHRLSILAVSTAAIAVAIAWVWLSAPPPSSVPRASAASARPPELTPGRSMPPATDLASATFAERRGSLSTGNIPLKGVSFDPVDDRFLFGTSSLYARLAGGRVKIIERTSGPGPGPKAGTQKLLWSGDPDEAQFFHEVFEGVDRLWDRKGKLLWTNDAANGSPDLRFERDEAGQARLLNKKRELLWAGTLPPGGHRGSSSGMNRDNTYRIASGGIRINGDGAAATVTDDDERVLWSGPLPKQPVILIRSGQNFTFMSPVRSMHGRNSRSRVDLDVERGAVTAVDPRGGTVGTQEIDFLKVTQEVEFAKDPGDAAPARTVDFPLRYLLPRISAGGDNGNTFRFANRAGAVIGTDSGPSAPVVTATGGAGTTMVNGAPRGELSHRPSGVGAVSAPQVNR